MEEFVEVEEGYWKCVGFLGEECIGSFEVDFVVGFVVDFVQNVCGDGWWGLVGCVGYVMGVGDQVIEGKGLCVF